MLNKSVYIVAVSGGVDSVVLLHKIMSQKNNDITCVVAHFNHGIRDDSSEDAKFVEKLAIQYDVTFELGNAELGANASESDARDARYSFLRKVASTHGAEKIITAHHQDDLIETMVLNMIRGTGPRGLSPMNQPDILRPLLNRTKAEILDYAKTHKLTWREDETNTDEKYLRNYIRLNLTTKLSLSAREMLLALQKRIETLYADIDTRISLLMPKKNILYRPSFVVLPFCVQKELIRSWMLRNGVQDIDTKLVERIAIACKTLPHGKVIDIKSGIVLHSEKQNILLTSK